MALNGSNPAPAERGVASSTDDNKEYSQYSSGGEEKLAPAARLHDLFLGCETHRGTYDPANVWTSWEGKVEIKNESGKGPRTLPGGPTAEHWEGHLAGNTPLGVAPQRADGLCRWGVLDVDDYHAGPTDLLARIAQGRVPVVPCRSKSGGLHLYLFAQDWVPLAAMVAALVGIRATLGLSADTEIFPKSGPENGSGWVNMPYFGGDQSDRCAYKPNGNAMTVAEFSQAVARSRKTAEGLAQLARGGGARTPNTRAARTAGEPYRVAASRCSSLADLVSLVAATAANRNEMLYAAAHRAGSLLVSGRLDADADRAVADLLAAAESVGLSVGEAGDTARRGLRDGQEKPDDPAFPQIASIVILTDGADETYWQIALAGHDRPVRLPVREVTDYRVFRNHCAEQLHAVFDPLRETTWSAMLREALDRAERRPLPEEQTRYGRFRELLEDFLVGRYTGNSPDDLLGGRPQRDEQQSRYWFRLRDLAKHLRNSDFGLPQERIAAYLVRLGASRETVEVRGASFAAYWVPEGIFDTVPATPLPPLRGPAL